MQFPSNIVLFTKQQIQENVEGAIEVEARISVGNPARYFKALELISLSLPRIEQYAEMDILYNSSNVRKRQRLDGSQRTEIIEKRSLRSWNIFNGYNYGIKISVSTEKPYTEDVDRLTPILMRIKSRVNFQEPNSPYRYDFSETKELDMSGIDISKVDLSNLDTYRSKLTTRYEMEVEITQLTSTALDKFNQPVLRLFQYAYGSTLPYTLDQRREIFQSVNQRIGGQEFNDKFDLNALTQARNLTVNDLSYGAMIPYIVMNGTPGRTEYYATVKADGSRTLVIIEPNGVWLGSPPDSINYQSHKGITISPEWIGSVFEGESIPISNRTSTMANFRSMYIVLYDCIYTPLNPDIRNQPLTERVKMVNNFVATIDPNNPIIKFSGKQYFPCRTVPEFYATAQAIIDNFDALPYKNDGIIFTPNGPYLPTGNIAFSRHATSRPTKPRTLANYTDVCKWKPHRLNTFDLLYEDNKFWVIGNNGGLELFKPNGKELNPTDVIYDLKPATFNEGIVYEIGWDFDLQKPLLYRIRHNKTLPNSAKVAYDAWKMLFNPLEINTLLGRDITLMRRYQNREKAKILNKGTGRLLDLGSGRGGDILKWGNYSTIYAIEPYEPNRQIFEQRLAEQSNTLKSKVTLYPYQAEDTDKIWQAIGEQPVDTISMMLSLTFLFKDEETLTALINTIDKCLAPGGQFLVTVMDGDLVKAMMANGLTVQTDSKKKLVFPIEGVVDFQLHDDNHTVDITLYGTIVENQTEYLTRMRDLSRRLEEKGLKLTTNYILDRERFLNPIESALTRMYSAWCWQREQVEEEEFAPPTPRLPAIGFVPQGLEGNLRTSPAPPTITNLTPLPTPQEKATATSKPIRKVLSLGKPETAPITTVSSGETTKPQTIKIRPSTRNEPETTREAPSETTRETRRVTPETTREVSRETRRVTPETTREVSRETRRVTPETTREVSRETRRVTPETTKETTREVSRVTPETTQVTRRITSKPPTLKAPAITTARSKPEVEITRPTREEIKTSPNEIAEEKPARRIVITTPASRK